MSAPRSAKAAAAAARVLAGEQKAKVARDTGVSRATIDRHLATLARLKAEAEGTAPSPAEPEPSSG